MSQDMKIIHNQLGFRPGHGAKRVLIPDVSATKTIFGHAEFWICEQGRFSKHPLNSLKRYEYTLRGELNRRSGDLGTWLEGDFTDACGVGTYQVYCGHTPGTTFTIRDDVWVRLISYCLFYLQVQSRGTRMAGWHDETFTAESEAQLPVPGGWRDSGDARDWVSSNCLTAISLIASHRLWHGREDELGLAPGALLDGVGQAIEFMLGMQDSHSGTVSDRDAAGKFTTLFAQLAEVLYDHDAGLSGRCLKAAKASLKADQNSNDYSMQALQWRAWGYLELWHATDEAQYLDGAVASLAQVLDLQIVDPGRGGDPVCGFFRDHPHKPGYHNHPLGIDVLMWIIGEFLADLPDHADAGRWRDAVAMWTEGYATDFAERNAFGLLPFSVVDRPAENDNGYRQLNDQLHYRYFPADASCGVNGRCLSSAISLAASARILNRSQLLDVGYRQLEWVLGNNPYQLSTMTGVGLVQPCANSVNLGNIPGGVTSGIRSGDDDQPVYDHPWLCHDPYRCDNVGQMLWAVLALQANSY